jgi:hypothetical protein
MRMLSKSVIVMAAAGLVGLGGLAPAGLAQQISESTITGGSVGASGQGEIKALIDANKAGLTGDAAAIKRSRSSLQQPLRTPGVSAEFRTVYALALKSVLEPLTKDKRDEVAVSALAIAGDMGTRDGLDLLTRSLQDERAAVRARAALGFARTFTTCREGTPALIPTQVDAALRTIAEQMGKERDGHVLDGLGAALEAAGRIPDQRVEGARLKAIELMPTSVSAAVRRESGGPATQALQMRATRALFEVLRDTSIQLPEGTVVAAAGLAGDALVAASRRLEGGNVSEDERSLLSLIATQSERVVISAGSRLGAPVSESKLGELLARSEDEKFRAEAAKLASAEGVLCKAPFSLPGERFAK